jgi:hypothetical protein
VGEVGALKALEAPPTLALRDQQVPTKRWRLAEVAMEHHIPFGLRVKPREFWAVEAAGLWKVGAPATQPPTSHRPWKTPAGPTPAFSTATHSPDGDEKIHCQSLRACFQNIKSSKATHTTSRRAKQIIAPMRQAWINNLRELLAELSGKGAHYWAAGFEEREDAEYMRIKELVSRLELYLNPKEDDHAQLVVSVRSMVGALSQGSNPQTDEAFWEAHEKVSALAKTILKREWNRVKSEI